MTKPNLRTLLRYSTPLLGIFFALISILPFESLAQDHLDPNKPEILEFRELDRRYLGDSIDRINVITSRHYGSRLRGETGHDIQLLQRLFNDAKVSPSQLMLLQSAGIALGDAIAKEQRLNWVRYKDQQGVSRALLDKETGDAFFPATMISRRYKVGVDINVQRLYDKTIDQIRHSRQIAADSY